MTDRAKLERGYRRLLAWYPRAFRREYGPEIVAVLMACARDGQRRPGLADSADLVRSGLRMARANAPASAAMRAARFSGDPPNCSSSVKAWQSLDLQRTQNWCCTTGQTPRLFGVGR
jgi:hypothetical protein